MVTNGEMWVAGRDTLGIGDGHIHTESVSSSVVSTLWDAMDCSLPGFSVPGILQARILEWIAMLSSRGSSQRRDRPRSSTLQVDSLPSEPPGKPS